MECFVPTLPFSVRSPLTYGVVLYFPSFTLYELTGTFRNVLADQLSLNLWLYLSTVIRLLFMSFCLVLSVPV